MLLYLDQMIRVEVAELFRADGHDVLHASETGSSRADDAQVLNIAKKQDRVLITFDEHFGDWAILPLSEHPGVVRVKMHPPHSARAIARMRTFLRNARPEKLEDHLVILYGHRERWIRTYPCP